MNKQINELVDITAEATPGVYTLVYDSGDKGVEFTESALRHFVELIVKECASVSENYASTALPLSISIAIKNHFGVE